MSKRLTAEQVAAEIAKIRGTHLTAMELADMECDTEEYEIQEYVADALTKSMWLVRHNLIETDEQRRERFERWYKSDCESRRGIFNRSMSRDMRGVGEYRDQGIETAWQAFQAALTWHGETEVGGE